MRLSEASRAFLSQRQTEGLSPYTLKAYRLQVDLLIRDVGDLDIATITIQILREHVAHHTHLQPASLGHKIRALRSFFRWAHEDAEVLERNPALKLKEPKLPKRLPKALDPSEVEILRDACRAPFEQALLEVLLATGCRVGEVWRMDRSDVRFDDRAARVIGKGNKEREVLFGPRAILRLRAYLGDRIDDDPALFVTQRRPHRRMSIHQIQYVVRRIASRSGLDKHVTPHVWRHTMATMAVSRGAPLDTVQHLLGHTDPKTTQLYAFVSAERLREDYRRFFCQ